MTCELIAPGEGYFVRADGDLLVRVFENLLANAIRYGRSGRLVKLILSREGGDTVAEVVNFGPPIPPEALPRLFDRFFRLDGSRADRAGGAGLGLAIAKSIVDLHGGEISALSDPARTSFRVRLRSDAPAAAGN
jgi:signal transduction histidine kinase